MVVSARATIRPPAPSKIKILATADELFYQEGIHTVGVDRIIAGARVTKATFYKHFRSKDLLIIAYVEGRDRQVREWFAQQERETDDPTAIARALVDSINASLRGAPTGPAVIDAHTLVQELAALKSNVELGVDGSQQDLLEGVAAVDKAEVRLTSACLSVLR